ncbi:tubulin binding cofactor A [Brevipalpus obovatus]|uniref:tubulin binding cofactor A n=1 Tax=Brevipalpus obovatus TaxID=246614 RepID=UPI003D9E08F5
MATEATEPRLKELRIKTGALKRLYKEVLCYQKELDTENARLKKLVESNHGQEDIAHQEMVVEECLKIIPITQQKLNDYYSDLENLVKECGDLKEAEIYQTAKQVLTATKP